MKKEFYIISENSAKQMGFYVKVNLFCKQVRLFSHPVKLHENQPWQFDKQVRISESKVSLLAKQVRLFSHPVKLFSNHVSLSENKVCHSYNHTISPKTNFFIGKNDLARNLY